MGLAQKWNRSSILPFFEFHKILPRDLDRTAR